jgi:hypothetical protein
MLRASLLPLLALCAMLAGTPAAQARNDSIRLPVDKAMAATHVHDALGELPLRFGGASANGVELAGPGDVLGRGVGSVVSDDPHARVHLSDDQACQRAFEDAVSQIAREARRANAAAVVGLMSDFKRQVVDDPHDIDCHMGSAKAYVTLRGKLARRFVAASSRRLPPATDFAALADVTAVPLSDEGRERYAHFLTLPPPRAFVVYEDGGWRFYGKDPEAMTKALDYCARQGRRCWLYAADDRVVWSADATKRIGSSSQLELPGAAR